MNKRWGVLLSEQTCRHVCDGACLCQRRPADMFVIPRACVVTDLRTCSWCLVPVLEQTCGHVRDAACLCWNRPADMYVSTCLCRDSEEICGHLRDGVCLSWIRPAHIYVIERACVGTDLRTCMWWRVVMVEQTCRHVRDASCLCRNRPAATSSYHIQPVPIY